MHQKKLLVTAQSIDIELAHGKILSNLTFSLHAGRYGLVGPNGIGKTSLAKVLAHLKQPSAGTIKSSHRIVYLEQDQAPSDQTVAILLCKNWSP